MNYYKNKENEIFAYDDEQLNIEIVQKEIKLLTKITKTELESFELFGVWTKTAEQIKVKKDTLLNQSKNEIIFRKLEDLGGKSSRALRAVALNVATKKDLERLASLDAEAVALRARLK